MLHGILSFGVAKQVILVKKTFLIIRARFFDASRLLQILIESGIGADPPPKCTNTHRNKKSCFVKMLFWTKTFDINRFVYVQMAIFTECYVLPSRK